MPLKLWLTDVVQKIGIYGGTFDPVHYAHLILAQEALEQFGLERMIFVPAAISPHKLDRTPTPAAIRLEMLGAAIAGEPRFAVDEFELNRPAPSFSIDTVEEFRRRNRNAEFYYLVGADHLPRLHTWHRSAELQAQVNFVVLQRGAIAPTSYRTIARQIDISATEIRNRVASGRSIRYLVPPRVEEIIERHQLYKEPSR